MKNEDKLHFELSNVIENRKQSVFDITKYTSALSISFVSQKFLMAFNFGVNLVWRFISKFKFCDFIKIRQILYTQNLVH